MTITYTDDQLIAVSDKLLTHIEGHLKTQLQSGRIQGTDYAQVYIAAIQASMSQAHSFLLGKDIAAGQASLLVEQNLQAVDLTTISAATVDERIALTENQKALSDEQLIQSGVQGNILDQQSIQSVQNSIVSTNQAEVSTGTKANQIALSTEQLVQAGVQGNIQDDQKLTTAQQVLQAVKQTSLTTTQDDIASSTKQASIDGVVAQTATAEEQLKVMQERHGINLTPQFT